MAAIIPFKGIRPVADKIHMVVTRSADNYKKEILKHKLETNPFSFLHIINPDFADGKRTRPGSPERLKKVKARYLDFLKEETFSAVRHMIEMCGNMMADSGMNI